MVEILDRLSLLFFLLQDPNCSGQDTLTIEHLNQQIVTTDVQMTIDRILSVGQVLYYLEKVNI